MDVVNQSSGKDWMLYQGDACEIIKGIPNASVGLSVFSPAFSSLYIYSDSVADMGNCASHEEFAEHYRYIAKELLRVVKPGRLCAVHCKDLPLYKGRDAAMGLFPFPDLLTRVHLECGWVLHSRITIWKDPVTEMQRTKNHGLLYKELCKDSCGSRQGMADYILLFRNWNGEFKDPVRDAERAERFDHYVGIEPPDPTEIANEFGFMVPSADKWGRWPKRNPFPPDSEAYRIWSIKTWQKYASPVWFDIDQMDVLNERVAREEKDCKHICPLQLCVIERCIHLWSNPGDVVFSPFAGIGSEIYTALKCGRKALGIELKESYHRQASKYMAILENQLNQPSLLDGLSDNTEDSTEDPPYDDADEPPPVEHDPVTDEPSVPQLMPDPPPIPMVREPVIDEPKTRKRKIKKASTTAMFAEFNDE